jgi:transcriptional regulator with XRE-family HTH domain
MLCSQPTHTIENLAQRKGLTVQELAERAGVSYTTAWRLIHGRPTRARSKAQLANFLELTPDAIAWGDLKPALS